MNDFTLERLEKSYPFLCREAEDIKELNSEEIVIKTIHNNFYIFNEKVFVLCFTAQRDENIYIIIQIITKRNQKNDEQ